MLHITTAREQFWQYSLILFTKSELRCGQMEFEGWNQLLYRSNRPVGSTDVCSCQSVMRMSVWEWNSLHHVYVVIVEKCYRVQLVKCPAALSSRLGDVHLFIRSRSLCLATCGNSSSPPIYLASWNISGLRRFGVIDDRFCFDAGESNGAFK